MYIWKCWRDTRNAFLSACLVLLSLVLTYVFVRVIYGPLDFADRGTAFLWWATAAALADGALVAVGLSAISFGACGIGEEFHRGTIQFLLARPRRRFQFVWTGWAVGAAELALLTPIAYLISRRLGSRAVFSDPIWHGMNKHGPEEAAAWKTILLFFIVSLLLYSLTYFTTMLMRGGRNGFNLAVLIFTAYFGLYVLLSLVWHEEIPIIFTMFHQLSDEPNSFPESALGWALLALAFPVASQLVFERAEV
ncbi:MAG: hypothetical protein HY046_08775 [Acidobacteria bacterium]|nr:hypothetical protein [Acidobacteriota bacterium]